MSLSTTTGVAVKGLTNGGVRRSKVSSQDLALIRADVMTDSPGRQMRAVMPVC
jgi:hypothetical protein